MEDTDFKDCCDLIKRKSPEIKCDFTNINEIFNILKKILDEHIISLTEQGIHHDYWPDDEELYEIETFYNMIKREIRMKDKKK